MGQLQDGGGQSSEYFSTSVSISNRRVVRVQLRSTRTAVAVGGRSRTIFIAFYDPEDSGSCPPRPRTTSSYANRTSVDLDLLFEDMDVDDVECSPPPHIMSSCSASASPGHFASSPAPPPTTANTAASGYRVLRSGNDIIYTGKICKEGAAEFQQKTYDAVVELEKRRKQAATAGAKKGPPASGGGGAAPPAPGGGGARPGGGGLGGERFVPPITEKPKGDSLAAGGGGSPSAKKMAASADGEVEASGGGATNSANGGTNGPNKTNGTTTNDSTNGTSTAVSGDKLRFHFTSAGGMRTNTDITWSIIGSYGRGDSTGLDRDGSYQFPLEVPSPPGWTEMIGSLPAGLAMMDVVTEVSHKYDTECHSKGFVGSAATFPAFACRKRLASELSVFLLHPPSKSGVHGQPDELAIHSENLDLWNGVSLAAYKRLSRPCAVGGGGGINNFGPVFSGAAAGGGPGAASEAGGGCGPPFGEGGSLQKQGMVVGGSSWLEQEESSTVRSVRWSSTDTGSGFYGDLLGKVAYPGLFGWELIKKSFHDNRYSRAEAVQRMGLIDGMTR